MIKEKCTAIHPVVEWRFRKAVLNTIERKSASVPDAAAEMEPIVFEGVYPLYGLADIRGSSVQRSVAIQADLLTQLGLAADVLRAACDARSLPALDELRYRVDKRIAQIAAEPQLRRRDRHRRLPARERRESVRLPGRVRPRRARADRGVPRRARRAARRGLPAATALRGERHAHRRGHLRVPRPRGAGRAGDVPALLREAEDGRRRLPDLRRPEPARGRPLRPHLPEEPAALAAHADVRHRRARPSAARPAARAARDHAPDPGAAHAAVDPLPLRREALRRRRRLRHPLRDRQEAHRQGGGGGHDATA